MDVNIYKDQMQKAYLFGTAVLHSNKPIPQEDVPQYWFRYDLRGTDRQPDRPYALVDQADQNYAGSILSPDAIFCIGHNEIHNLQCIHLLLSTLIFV